VITDTDSSGEENVTLNASSSSDANGQIVQYQWLESSLEIATGVSPNISLTVGSHTIDLIVTDNDGLTNTDSLIVNVQDPSITVSLPTFQTQSLDATLRHGQNLRLQDLDGDGDIDATVAYSFSDQVVTYLNGGDSNGGGDGSVWSSVSIAASNSIVAMDVTIADFDGDNQLDIASVGLFDRSVGFSSPGEVVWYQNPGSVTGAWTANHFTGLNLWGAINIKAGDLTGDNRTDLIVSSVQMSDANGNRSGPQY